MGIALSFVAIVTPYEVAFIDAPTVDSLGPLFVVNRLIDFLFLIDMFIVFSLAVRSFANNFTPAHMPAHTPAHPRTLLMAEPLHACPVAVRHHQYWRG